MTSAEQTARRVEIIGIGAGSPEHLTVAGIDALRRVDVFLVPEKGESKRQLVDLRTEIAARYGGTEPGRIVTVPDPERGPDAARDQTAYAGAVHDWHAERTRRYAEIITGLPEHAVVGFLVWGDPAFYDSTIRIVDRLGELLPLEVVVTPGISAFQALAAAHRIVLHEVGAPVHITTGRKLIDTYSPELGTVVVMLDGHLACRGLIAAHPDLSIHWGAQLGMPSQRLIAGRLADVIDEIENARAAVRARDGWVMDVYALSLSR